jgi:hypothetical protein
VFRRRNMKPQAKAYQLTDTARETIRLALRHEYDALSLAVAECRRLDMEGPAEHLLVRAAAVMDIHDSLAD